VKLDRSGKYTFFVEYLRDLNDATEGDGKPRPVESNLIVVEVMAASH
jgi:hypothetical protein